MRCTHSARNSIIEATVAAFLLAFAGASLAAEPPAAAQFRTEIQPILTEYCYDCHADGANKGGVAFDELKTDDAILSNHELWAKVLKNVRSGLMPPAKKARPSDEERAKLVQWIKYDAFGIDPKNPDPGRVTVRRLNRVEYHNTIRDLMDVDYDTEVEFPADDTGYGFDNIGDVLTLPPMLLEKYIGAARSIIGQAVPTVSLIAPEQKIAGRNFRNDGSGGSNSKHSGSLYLSYYQPASVSNTFQVEHAGRYQLMLDIAASEKFVDDAFDYNRCRFVFKADGQELLRHEYGREGNRSLHYEFERNWQAGPHEMTFELEPLTTNEQVRSLAIRVDSITVRGPDDTKIWVRPPNYAKFFPKDVPGGAAERRAYARDLLRNFATRAYRRPVDDDTLDRLVGLAERFYKQPHQTFEAGVAQAMVAVLASPRFLFREEKTEPVPPGQTSAFVDEYALASRLSYFLWSSMPDAELFRLAGRGELRINLAAQVKRMLGDWKAEAITRNFTGQWLQARDIDNVPIEAKAVLALEDRPNPEFETRRNRMRELRSKRDTEITPEEKAELAKLRAEFFKSRQPRADLTGEIRYAMRRETEMYFANIVREDRSVLELIDSDYTFLNERLARHYGLTNLNVSGDEMRKVTLPPDCPRGGVLTMGTVLAVTSNPTRTSPVKRGLFVLDNILGIPPPPPPPNIPALEDAAKDFKDHTPTLRETLAAHRSNPLCSSCHNRMDPLGLAFENFNAMGMWRDKERGQPIDSTGKLITGETFESVHELKHILATNHHLEFYRTLTEKMLTYALGRGLDYSDVETVDEIVDSLEKDHGRFSALLDGIIESAPFQKRRTMTIMSEAGPARPTQERADVSKPK
ncbi:MAG TPA: DUF1592 domain-containing protein [Verrucomicrobiae bacterium]|nr:DUF1592 domain-containing protein [Verrucomicrobiae bacterium]